MKVVKISKYKHLFKRIFTTINFDGINNRQRYILLRGANYENEISRIY